VDIGLEQGVRRLLEEAYPGIPVYGEEAGRSGPNSADMAWHLDPVDGTTNFVHQIPASAFSLGLVDAEQIPVLGLVINLFTGDAFYGRDQILWLNHAPVTVPTVADVAGEVVLAELEGFRVGKDMANLQRWLEGHYGTLRILGSSALALAETAVGHSAAAVLSRFNTWDVAGGLALCRAAGLRWASRRGLTESIPMDGVMVGASPVVDALWAAIWSEA
jgi:myo-inositol-1(or 4)-monophosphatase